MFPIGRSYCEYEKPGERVCSARLVHDDGTNRTVHSRTYCLADNLSYIYSYQSLSSTLPCWTSVAHRFRHSFQVFIYIRLLAYLQKPISAFRFPKNFERTKFVISRSRDKKFVISRSRVTKFVISKSRVT